MRCMVSVEVFTAAAGVLLSGKSDVPEFIGHYWQLLATIGHYWPLLAAIEPYWPLLGPVLPTRTFPELIYNTRFCVQPLSFSVAHQHACCRRARHAVIFSGFAISCPRITPASCAGCVHVGSHLPNAYPPHIMY